MKSLYVIRDNVAKAAAGPVMSFAHDAVATRSFMDIAGDEKSSLVAHLEDYDLVRVGKLDEESLVLYDCVPDVVVSGAAVKAMRESQQGRLALEA